MGIPAVNTAPMSRFLRSPALPLHRHAFARGFSLLELMIALALGLLLSAGILTLFSSTSQTNKLQNGLARLQENGRFAVTRMEGDLRMAGGQFCNNMSGSGGSGSAPMMARRMPGVFAANLAFPDSGPGASGISLDEMNSVDAAGYPSADPAAGAWLMSPRYFIQGYSCPTDTDCTTGLPDLIPDQGLAAGNRVPASDVLTVRYVRGSGWPVQAVAGVPAACASGDAITLAPQTGDDPLNLAAGELALVTDCQNASVLPVAGVAGNVVTLGALLSGQSAHCSGTGDRDNRLFNFSRDFVTVSYFLQFMEDDNPDAQPNSGAARRLLPVLMRRENGVAQELVRGVDLLRFRFGVQQADGGTQFLNAAEVDAGTSCPEKPEGLAATEPGCLWRAVSVIEARLLVNTVDEVFSLDDSSRTYHFDGTEEATTPTTTLPSGLRAGSMLRREFVAYASNRNYNF